MMPLVAVLGLSFIVLGRGHEEDIPRELCWWDDHWHG